MIKTKMAFFEGPRLLSSQSEQFNQAVYPLWWPSLTKDMQT